jgi:hypothetical protein
MSLDKIVRNAQDKTNFRTLQSYISFCIEYLNYINGNLQAVIISQNENHYRFYQYNKEGNFQISRPINSNLMYELKDFKIASREFLKILHHVKTVNKHDDLNGNIINNTVYTIQQSIGAALDALPAGQSNKARKINGDLFENFIRLIINEIGVVCSSETIKVPVIVDGQRQFDMSYQHDLVVKDNEDYKLIGSIKTSNKDRIDKIFIDKFLHNKLTETEVPHIAIFLNDVQRKGSRHENAYGISATFLPGHFKGYTVKLNSLDGVYYCDIRPNMKTDSILKQHIRTFDKLILDDIWEFV